jgi:hypothetical protein
MRKSFVASFGKILFGEDCFREGKYFMK